MGHFFDGAGLVVATVAQEGIVKHFPGGGSSR
jgi:acyl-CoA thioesterase-2